MDLTSILPLLMRQDGSAPTDDRMATLMKVMNAGKDGQSPDIGTLMHLAGSMKKPERKPVGLRPIKDIVPNDILGRLVKFFA